MNCFTTAMMFSFFTEKHLKQSAILQNSQKAHNIETTTITFHKQGFLPKRYTF